MGDKKNQDKIQSIIKFFKDWWPTLLAAYLLFGNAFGKMAVKLGVMVGKFAINLLKNIIPKLLAGLAKMKMGKLGKAGLIGGTLLVGGALIKNMMGKGDSGEETEVPSVSPRGDRTEAENQKFDEMSEAKGFNKGGQVAGSGNTDTVPAMLTPGEFVMSRGAVQRYGTDTLAGMNAAAGGTNIPTLMGGFNEGGKVQTMSEKLGHTRGVVTDPKEKAQQESYMLKFVNEERALQGMEPLTNLTYAPGVELTKMMGPGPKTTETSDTDMNFETGMKSTWKTKSRGGETIFQGSTEMITQEDRDKFFAANPHARMMLELKDQAELDALGADISASAKMNGGGLVQGFQGGGQVQGGRGRLKDRPEVQALRKNAANIRPKKTVKNITPSPKKKTTVAYQNQGGSMKSAGGTGGGNKEIPSFSATAMRSKDKIKVLGISV